MAEGSAPPLGPDQRERYARHLRLPEVGVDGQRRLLGAKVLVVGTGGLGSPAAIYLAAAGVGEIGLAEFDTVDVTNLQRQILFAQRDVGRPKLEAASERLTGLNPGIRVTPHAGPLTSGNALEVVRGYDVVLDGSDNFATRYLVNDACVLLGKPDVYGSVYRFEGQASVFDARRGPCYRCLFPEPPPPDAVPSCDEAGVLGVLPGVVGTLQAAEAIKILLGIGESLVGRLLLIDLYGTSFRELAIRKSPTCPLCSANPTQRGLIDYARFCGTPIPGADGSDEVSARALAEELAGADPPYLLDVREPREYAIAHLAGAHLLPGSELLRRLEELPRDRPIVVYCHRGHRSRVAARALAEAGRERVRSLAGGIDAWSREVDPSVRRY